MADRSIDEEKAVELGVKCEKCQGNKWKPVPISDHKETDTGYIHIRKPEDLSAICVGCGHSISFSPKKRCLICFRVYCFLIPVFKQEECPCCKPAEEKKTVVNISQPL